MAIAYHYAQILYNLGEYIKPKHPLSSNFCCFCCEIHNLSSKSSSDSTFCAPETRPYSTRSPKQRICWWEKNAGDVLIKDDNGNDCDEGDDGDEGDDDEDKDDNDDNDFTEPLDPVGHQQTNLIIQITMMKLTTMTVMMMVMMMVMTMMMLQDLQIQTEASTNRLQDVRRRDPSNPALFYDIWKFMRGWSWWWWW